MGNIKLKNETKIMAGKTEKVSYTQIRYNMCVVYTFMFFVAWQN